MSVGSDISAKVKSVSGWTWVYGGIAIAAIVVILLFVFHKVRSPVADPAYQYIQKQTDSLLKVDRLYTADSVRAKLIDSFLSQANNKQDRIKTITKYREKVITLYKDYTADSVHRFLTNRYPSKR